MSTQTYPLTQVLKNFSYVRSTINVHLKDDGVDKEAWLSIASRVAALQEESLALLNKKSAPAQPQQQAAAPTPVPTGAITVLHRDVTNKVAARMAQHDVVVAAKNAKNALKLSRKPEKQAEWQNRLAYLKAEWIKAEAFIRNPANPEV